MQGGIGAGLSTMFLLSVLGTAPYLLWNFLNTLQMLMLIPLVGYQLPQSLHNFFDGFELEFLPNFFEMFVDEKD
jgi:hypothetical protein